jgi:hypothetical protein
MNLTRYQRENIVMFHGTGAMFKQGSANSTKITRASAISIKPRKVNRDILMPIELHRKSKSPAGSD